DYQGAAAAFESEGTYYGMHLGAGYVARLTGRATLDLYGKHLLTRREGDEVALSTGETVRFAEATSVRARSGGRLSYLMEGGLSPYLGAAWEREFDGEVAAFIEGVGLGRPTLAGDSGMYEAGVAFGAAGDGRFSLDLGVQGYSGHRVGITGSARLNVNF
ncbi:MAG: autotransporter outer membrane beta-barrel domain-containing protein, partial [Acidobacteriota bacterium]|nr:autotransporter outer membrane beta-barrel domain-containing protein [Acidobacteriota bacterium]